MQLFEKIDMFLLSEAKTGVSLSVLAKSSTHKLKGWDKEEIESVVNKMSANVKDDKKYEIAFMWFDKKSEVTPLMIYRKDDDVIKRNLDATKKQEYKKDVESVIKGTGLKVSGETKQADWVAFTLTK